MRIKYCKNKGTNGMLIEALRAMDMTAQASEVFWTRTGWIRSTALETVSAMADDMIV